MHPGDFEHLKTCLMMIDYHDAKKNYDARNRQVYLALASAVLAGYRAGIRLDPSEPNWPVVYIDLPTGQVSWHVPGYDKTWDGHTTEVKYQRVREYLA